MSDDLTKKILKQKISEKVEDQLYMENHYKELIQHCYLFALSKTDFFNYAAFHGGTCLRIVDKIDRFSEDLDFVTIQPDTPAEKLTSLLNEAVEILKEMGLPLDIKHNNINNNVQKVWIKEGVLVKKFLSENPKYALQEGKSRIKIEIDIDPPDGSTYKEVNIEFPENFKIKIQDHNSSFSGKLHAVLCREFFHGSNTYIKGRDYFDLDWYLTQKIQPNYELLGNALFKTGPYKNQEIKVSKQWLYEKLENKLKTLNWDLAKKDMTNLLLLNSSLDNIEKILTSGAMIKKLGDSFGGKL